MSTQTSSIRSPAKRGSAKFWVIGTIVVVLLAGVRVTSFGPSPGQKAKYESTRIFVRTDMAKAFDAYRQDMGELASTQEGLSALLQTPKGKNAKWHGPYLNTPTNRLPLDAWDESYIYRQPGTHNPAGYDLFSKGPDRIGGTGDDIGNW